ncbi:hypothetical protein MTO96_043291, partial [Rhipicephalus appendiculatus]
MGRTTLIVAVLVVAFVASMLGNAYAKRKEKPTKPAGGKEPVRVPCQYFSQYYCEGN